VALGEAFAAAGMAVLRCDLPYRQRRRTGPPAPRDAPADRAGLRHAVQALRETCGGRLFLGGQSYGGRMASMLLADEPGLASGLLLLSYPVHPPGRPDDVRSQHLPGLRAPVLFVHGDRDPFGSPDEVAAVRALVPAATGLVQVPGGHDLGWGGGRGDPALPGRIVEAFHALMAGR